MSQEVALLPEAQPELKQVTCNKCGMVAMQVSRSHAENEVMRFNAYYDTLPRHQQVEMYGGKESNLHQYEHCMLCNGPYQNFRDYREGDCPDGCTLGPIINRNE